MGMEADTYRWIGFVGILMVLANYWLALPFVHPLARLLMLVFAYMYWRDRKDTFAVLLLVVTGIIFILGIATILQIFITPGLI